MKTIILIIAALSALLSSCNTVDGVGRDVEATGDALQRSANR